MNITLQNLSFRSTVSGNSKKQKSQNETKFSPVVRPKATVPPSLLDKNYNCLLVKKNNVNFGKNVPSLPFDYPIGQKIASVMQILKNDDIILVGNNAKEAKNLLKESVSSVNKVIKRLFLIEDKQVQGAFTITKDDSGSMITNLDKKSMYLKSSDQKYILKKGTPAILFENDKIYSNGTQIEILSEESTDLSYIRNTTVKPFDFSNQDKTVVENLNIKHLDQIDALKPALNAKKIKFEDVGGQDKAIADLKKAIIYPIKYPSAFKNNIINRGTILTGGPGTGKTLLAQALANESDAHFIKLNGLEMESKWVGESEENWRNLFAEAQEHQPSVIFIDEFDAVAKKREGSSTSRYDDKVVNQLLTLMSDAEKGEFGNVFVVVATNKINLLDDAIVRSGRFGKHIAVEKPDLKGCKHIFDIHSKNKPISEKLNVDEFTQKLYEQKTSGADISHIVNEAHQEAFNRTGVFEKMEAGTFADKDAEDLKIEPEDLEKALADFKAQSAPSQKQRPVIGYKQSTQAS